MWFNNPRNQKNLRDNFGTQITWITQINLCRVDVLFSLETYVIF